MHVSNFNKFYEGDNREFNALDYIHKYESPIRGLLFSKLFWPELVEVEGAVFLSSVVEDSSDRERVKRCFEESKSIKYIESSFNLLDWEMLFGKRNSDTNDNESYELLNVLQLCWEACLKKSYPKRDFTVEVDENDLSITFFQDEL